MQIFQYLKPVKIKVVRMTSPHYDHRDSILKLTFIKFFKLIFYITSKKPKKSDFKELNSLKNQFCGETALVLGNGPSLDLLNATEISKYVDKVFVVNDFFRANISSYVKADFYTLSDPANFDKKSDKNLFANPQFCNYVKTSNSVLFYPHFASISESFHSIKFNDFQFDMSRNIVPTKARSYASVTLYKALAICCFMGFKKIYILGLDNTEFYGYKGTPDNRTIVDGSKHYAIRHNGEIEINTEFNDILVSGMAGRMRSYARLFSDLTLFPADRILNLNPYSLVDVFPKEINHPLIRKNPL